MITIISFGHPLSLEARAQLEETYGFFETRRVPFQLNLEEPLAPQVSRIVDMVGFTADQWQTTSFLVVLPELSAAVALLLAELHGRSGGFPRVISLVSGEDRVFRVSEVLDLQQVRHQARQKRHVISV